MVQKSEQEHKILLKITKTENENDMQSLNCLHSNYSITERFVNVRARNISRHQDTLSLHISDQDQNFTCANYIARTATTLNTPQNCLLRFHQFQ